MNLAPVVHMERDGDVAVLIIDNPPINAASAQVRRELLLAIERVSGDDNLRAAVIIGQGRGFIAGSDLREFGQPLQDPQLPEVIAAIEACAKPVVAALHGAALGGGFELAMGCDVRIASPACLLGLPEVTLGIIPGAGGTQRLPRLVGMAAAIELICSGMRVNAVDALKSGMIDAIADDDLRTVAVRFAHQAHKRPVLEMPIPEESPKKLEATCATALRKGRGRPAVQAAIEAVLDAARLPAALALSNEREAFQRLRLSPEAAALRHLFFAERGAGRLPEADRARSIDVEQVGIIGAGTMGAGIAVAFLDGGFSVTLIEQSPAALAAGLERIDAFYARQLHSKKLTEKDIHERLQRLHPSCAFEALVACQLVVEAVFEDMAVKRELMMRLDAVLSAETIIASNTSYLDLDVIAAASARPDKVCGLHFFSPANVMPLLEVVRGAATTSQTLATALAVGKRLGKVPVIAANAFGFIGNRIYAAYRRQCEYLLEDGASPQQIDAAMQAFGFAMGPFAVADLSGLDIAWRMRKAAEVDRDPRVRYVAIADRLCEAGRLGRKTGAGYYRYADEKRLVDPFVETLIAQEREKKGLVPQTFSDAEIQQRLLSSMVSEAVLLLAQKVAQQAGDIDLVLVNGYGFPRWEGGPLFWARRQDPQWLGASLRALTSASQGIPVASVEQVMAVLGAKI
ncbi:3-hydroxyacyl-CoA dehydrogenase NAD-binding domain-containing protein [Pseudomonas sp. GM60]|uniref:3-hydroxyacyl-CoA dehydrogenase NAD-binding domain-containing protein n=1 Tax=Pseudomonas sp. GM60 TaxID=1144334 RepID=UPI00027075AE|nr:3-hydroxyacyl-CoA dehydrogenase NAD-binding domain-containing protein [Pseudomonas sp. GM60]EJM88434.1 3-hydroxyacyl-CoA dehydrogenase [Pseudomonas sp. GM60]